MSASALAGTNEDPQSGALIRLRGIYPSLKAALQKVANVILRQPEMAIYASVNEVAAMAGVSEATVMRFCRVLGFKGFQDFKIALAREMVTPSPRFQEEIALGDDPGTIVRKVFQTMAGALEDTLEVLDMEALGKAAQLLLSAEKIMIVGGDGAGPVLAYAGNRFLVLGLNASQHTEFHLMMTAAALLSRNDAMLAICHSGNTRELLETVRVALEAGAGVIAVTNNTLSPLARLAHQVLITASREAKYFQGGTDSFPAQIAMIDGLFVLMFQARPERAQKNLTRIEKALSKLPA